MIKKIIIVTAILSISIFSFDKAEAAEQDCSDANKTWIIAEWCINKTSFMIDTNILSPWWNTNIEKWSDISETSDNLFAKIIENLMIALWVLALLAMTIWGWYMIFYRWADELLSRWKTIFMSWLTALVVALSAWFLVKFVAYLLY